MSKYVFNLLAIRGPTLSEGMPGIKPGFPDPQFSPLPIRHCGKLHAFELGSILTTDRGWCLVNTKYLHGTVTELDVNLLPYDSSHPARYIVDIRAGVGPTWLGHGPPSPPRHRVVLDTYIEPSQNLMLIFSPTIPATQPGRYTCWCGSHMAKTWSPTDRGWCLVNTPNMWWDVCVVVSPSHHSRRYSRPLPTRFFTDAVMTII